MLSLIQSQCRPGDMLEAGRLNTVLEQALQHQVSLCKFHDSTLPLRGLSLLQDHQCEEMQLA